MANASKKSIGPGSQGKGDGSGAMTELPEGLLEENMVLSNRDKAQHSEERGLDSRMLQTEQYHDHAGNRRVFDANGEPVLPTVDDAADDDEARGESPAS